MKPKTLSVALGAIDLGPNHRTNFDPTSLNELADSIAQVGVLQAIILRTVPGKESGYQLVAGERRYRAAMIVYERDSSKLTIPAVIYTDLSDEDALEIQITENLQREDVHAMEEANAFKKLAQTKGYELPEIALRFGKTAKYVGQRLKLTDLIGDIQAAFAADKMDLGLALQLCKFSTEIQVQIYDKEIKKQLPGKVHIEPYNLQDYHGNLALAAFDLDDTTLNPAMGACATCQHNTGLVGGLFPEDAKNARCGMVKCFAGKVKKHYDRELKTVLNDGTIALITTEYGRNNALADKLKGHKVYSRNDYSNSNIPQRPNIEKYESDLQYQYTNATSREEMLAEFDKDMAKYEKDQKAYDKKVAGGQYTKAFIVSGDGAGKYVHVQLDKKESGAKAKPAEMDVDTIDAEIKRLKDREERNQELYQEKTLDKIHEFVSTFRIDENAVKADLKKDFAEGKIEPLHHVELRGLVILLYNNMGWSYKDEFFEVIGFKEEPDEIEFYEHLASAKEGTLQHYIAILTRQCLIAELAPKTGEKHFQTLEMRALVDLLAYQCEPQLKEIMKEQGDVAEKRQGRVNKRIAELEAAKAQPEPDNQDNAEPGKKKAAKKTTQKTE